MSTTLTKHKGTNPFVYVIAALIIGALSLGIRYVIESLDETDKRIQEANEVKNYLVSPKPKAPAMDDKTMETGTSAVAK